MKEINYLRHDMHLTGGPNPLLAWNSSAHEAVASEVYRIVCDTILDQIANPLKNTMSGARRW